ncbi:chemotaxis protein CheD [Piscibacillus halophilus]|uniref:Probable chemoreceptor glutamine deamidase CheD n=1 Tax=Piscibacillus halophilus TaxID=571933 RepID=A0A1H8Z0H3_9BACI|nr:chemotaxis protein CheD [Piscibacillus halophilus]SEP57767.1 chemotaxis protein CheD [Piscibacillus halophilus]
MNNCSQVKVGIADIKTAKQPQMLMTSGLGSCVGLVIYDETLSVAGLAHIMLPDSSLSRQNDFKVGKFADTGTDELINLLLKEGSKITNLKAKIAGGAQMFKTTSGNKLNIGNKNVLAVEEKLNQIGIPIVSKDIGGHNGRSIEFNLETFKLKIRTVYQGVSFI